MSSLRVTKNYFYKIIEFLVTSPLFGTFNYRHLVGCNLWAKNILVNLGNCKASFFNFLGY